MKNNNRHLCCYLSGKVYYGSLAIALLSITVGIISYTRQVRIPQSDIWTSIVQFPVLDPMLLYVLSFVFVFIYWYLAHYDFENKRKLLVSLAIFGFLGVSWTFIEYYLIESIWLKPALNYIRPEEGVLDHPLISKWVSSQILGSSSPESTGAPSGFVLRQLFVTLFGLSILSGRKRRKLGRSAFGVFLILTLAWVIFSRVYLRHHFLFDAMLAVGIGTIIFWIGFLPGNALRLWFYSKFFSKINESKTRCWRLLADRSKSLVPFYLIVVLITFVISGDSAMWGILIPGLLLLVGLTLKFSRAQLRKG
ncbi:phosphatase PAP2 family protein [Candidatus Bipolaricaulota bacterium]|nr:phosphatase PAP2 family protein [Candidatus Bipolaricaulota bacterium]